MLGLIIRLAIGATLLTAAIGLITWYVVPLYDETAVLRAILEQRTNELAKKEETKIKVAEILKQYETLAKEAEKVTLSVPSDKDIPSLLVTMEALAAETGMVMDSLIFSETLPPAAPERAAVQKFKMLGISTSLRGSYGAFKNYLAALENNVRVLDLTNISFAGKETAADVMQFTIRIQTYFQ